MKRIFLASECFSSHFWQTKKSRIHLQGRIIPLNKINHGIPTVDEIRFIVATSPIQKLLEAYLLPELMSYCKSKLTKTQRGFISGFSVHHNLKELLDPVNANNEVLLVDLKKAFDMVDRSKLYDILKQRSALSDPSFKLLTFIHSNSTVSIGSHMTQTTKGVSQGSLISPLLFNIFIATLLQPLSDIGLTLGFADDISCSLPNQQLLEMAIQKVEDWCT